MLHYLYVGHFDRDEHGVRFIRTGEDSVYRPAVARPLTDLGLSAFVRDATGERASLIPDDWSARFEQIRGYVICDLYLQNPEEIEFVSQLVEREGCSLCDVSGHSELSLTEWLGRLNKAMVSQPV